MMFLKFVLGSGGGQGQTNWRGNGKEIKMAANQEIQMVRAECRSSAKVSPSLRDQERGERCCQWSE